MVGSVKVIINYYFRVKTLESLATEVGSLLPVCIRPRRGSPWPLPLTNCPRALHRAVSSYGRADHEEVPDLARAIPSRTFYALPHPLQLSGFTISRNRSELIPLSTYLLYVPRAASSPSIQGIKFPEFIALGTAVFSARVGLIPLSTHL